MLAITRKQAEKVVRDYCDETYTKKIDVAVDLSVRPPMDGRCHHNAAWAVRSGKAVAVVECIMIYDNNCIAHYINLLENGDYVDYTLGFEYQNSDYRLVRILRDVPDVAWDALKEMKDSIVKASSVGAMAIALYHKNKGNNCLL